MFCPDCGADVAEGRKFCGKCGGQVNAASQVMETPKSGLGATAAVAPARVREVAPLVAAPAAPKSFMTKIAPFVILLVVAAAGGAWWWFNRPAPAFERKDPGLYEVTVEGKRGFVDAQGNMVIQPSFEQSAMFEEDMCAVQKDGKWGYIDRSGRMAISPQFDSAGNFSPGLALAPVMLNGNNGSRWGYIDKKGAYAINPQFSEVRGFHDGLAAVKSENKWGFVDTRGKFVIKPSYDLTFQFGEGLASVQQGSEFGFIDRNGIVKIKPHFSWALSFSGGLAPVRVGSQWGYVDHGGKIVINPQFDSAGRFKNGLAGVTVAGKSATINKQGKFVINPGQYQLSAVFDVSISGDLQVQTADGIGVISRSGTWVLQPSKAVQKINKIYQNVIDLQIAGEECLVNRQGDIIFGKYKGSTLATVSQDIDSEASALGTVRVLIQAEATYSSVYPAKGFTASLDKLGPATGTPDENHAGLVDSAVATGTKAGYQFAVNIPEGTSTGGTNFNYFIVAKPGTGHVGRTFCTDSSGTIRYAVQGAECTTTSPTVDAPYQNVGGG